MEILDKKNIWTEIESSVFELDIRYDTAKDRISEEEKKSIENIENEAQRLKINMWDSEYI